MIVLRRFLAASGWICLLAVLVIGLPLFICMPLWVDVTYHDLSARNILRGGTHYRDIFETNLPGMVWLHAIVRPVVGWSSEAIRAVDIAVVAAIVGLLAAFLRRCGLTIAALGWFAAGSFFFYVFESEYIHCQRDGWMLLPTVVALHLRARQASAAATNRSERIYWRGCLEGAFWGCAVWIKPHALLPALTVYALSARGIAGLGPRKGVFDLLGLVTGGVLIGGLGCAWLAFTETWPYMWDVLLNWNGEYYKWTPEELDYRLSMVLMYFAPWSLLHLAALPLALVALIQARAWYWGAHPAVDRPRRDRGLLAALYLGWLIEAVLLQKTFHYSQAPVIFLALAVVASYRWPVGFALIAWCLLAAELNNLRSSRESFAWLEKFKEQKPYTYQQIVPGNRLINEDWRSNWLACWQNGSTPQMKNQLRYYPDVFCSPNWVELDKTRRFLETLHLRDGELVCWDDTTHPLYLDLNLRPSFRFMHVNTSLGFRSKRGVLREELIATGHKYVISDMVLVQAMYGFDPQPPAGQPLALPEEFPCFCRDIYPWNQPVIAQFGRYRVHRVVNPILAIKIPSPLAFPSD